MRPYSVQASVIQGWRVWVLATIFGELCWFALLYPLVPRTMEAAAVEAVLAIPIVGYVYLASRALFWLADSRWPPAFRRACGIALALSVGCFIVAAILLVEHFMGTQFGYGLFRRA